MWGFWSGSRCDPVVNSAQLVRCTSTSVSADGSRRARRRCTANLGPPLVARSLLLNIISIIGKTDPAEGLLRPLSASLTACPRGQRSAPPGTSSSSSSWRPFSWRPFRGRACSRRPGSTTAMRPGLRDGGARPRRPPTFPTRSNFFARADPRPASRTTRPTSGSTSRCRRDDRGCLRRPPTFPTRSIFVARADPRHRMMGHRFALLRAHRLFRSG